MSCSTALAIREGCSSRVCTLTTNGTRRRLAHNEPITVRSKNCPCACTISGANASSSRNTRRRLPGEIVRLASKLKAISSGAGSRTAPARLGSRRVARIVGASSYSAVMTTNFVAGVRQPGRQFSGEMRAAARPGQEEVVEVGDTHRKPVSRGPIARSTSARSIRDHLDAASEDARPFGVMVGFAPTSATKWSSWATSGSRR